MVLPTTSIAVGMDCMSIGAAWLFPEQGKADVGVFVSSTSSCKVVEGVWLFLKDS